MSEPIIVMENKASSLAKVRQRARLPYNNVRAMALLSRGLEAWIELSLANRLSLVRVVAQWEQNWMHDRTFYCDDRTLGCFSPSNPVRQGCTRLLGTTWFVNMVDVVIFLCTLSIAINCPLWFPQGSDGWWFFYVQDIVFSIFFTFELGVRLVAEGCCCKPGAVLRTGWGRLDTVVVVSSWAAMMEGLPDFKGGRAIRTLRVLRSLRSLRSLRMCKWFATALDAIEIALDGLLDVTVAGMFFLLLYAVLGLPLFMGDLDQQCYQIGSGIALKPEQWCGRDKYGTEWSSTGLECPSGFKCEHVAQSLNHG